MLPFNMQSRLRYYIDQSYAVDLIQPQVFTQAVNLRPGLPILPEQTVEEYIADVVLIRQQDIISMQRSVEVTLAQYTPELRGSKYRRYIPAADPALESYTRKRKYYRREEIELLIASVLSKEVDASALTENEYHEFIEQQLKEAREVINRYDQFNTER